MFIPRTWAQCSHSGFNTVAFETPRILDSNDSVCGDDGVGSDADAEGPG